MVGGAQAVVAGKQVPAAQIRFAKADNVAELNAMKKADTVGTTMVEDGNVVVLSADLSRIEDIVENVADASVLESAEAASPVALGGNS
ncbi:hypothetical protein ACFL96_01740 [Thermoproteota archaeon]